MLIKEAFFGVMGDYRSRTYGGADYRMDVVPSKVYNGGGQIQVQPQPQPPQLPYAYGSSHQQQPPVYMDGAYNYKNTKTKSSKVWGLNDPEVKRRKRVASYKVYTVEGKVKGSFRKSFRWLKDKYTEIVYGWW